jgi:archaellum biogenesis protein FlaJ (TadC family)
MDSYLNILSLALAVAALVPVLFPMGRTRLWTITAGALMFVVLLAVYQLYKEYSERTEVRATREEILTILSKQEKGQPFEQITDQLYRRGPLVANTALDSLVADRQVLHEKRACVDSDDGTKYQVRRFYRASN